MVQLTIDFRWMQSSDDTASLAAFFVRNVGSSYISHGEIIAGRSVDGRAWAANLKKIIVSELNASLNLQSGGVRPALAEVNGKMVGLAIVRIERAAAIEHAWIEDLVIKRGSRRQGVGARFLNWIEAEMRRSHIRWLFLENGFRNPRAHKFFLREGYSMCSVVMKKHL